MFGWFKKEKLISNLNSLFKQKKYERVIELSHHALSEGLVAQEFYTFQIWSLLETKQIEKANQVVIEALELYKDNSVFMSLSGEILYRLDQFDAAQHILVRALELSPSNLQIEYMLGLTHVAKGELEEASEYFDSILRYDPTLLQTRLLAMAEHHAFVARKNSRS